MALSFKKVKEAVLGLPRKILGEPKTHQDRKDELRNLRHEHKHSRRSSATTAMAVTIYGSGLSAATGCIGAFLGVTGEMYGCNTLGFGACSAIGGGLGVGLIAAGSYAVHQAGNAWRCGTEAVKKIQCKRAKNREDKAAGITAERSNEEKITTKIIETAKNLPEQILGKSKTHQDRKYELRNLRHEHKHSRKVSAITAMGATVYGSGLSLATGVAGAALSVVLESSGVNTGDLATNSALYGTLTAIAIPAVAYTAHQAGNAWRCGTEAVKKIQCTMAKNKEERNNNLGYGNLTFAR